MLRAILLFSLLLFSVPAGACFGPKLYFGTMPGANGELLYHLVALYVKEKTGVESVRVELKPEQTVVCLLQDEKIDFGFSRTASSKWPTLLTIGDQLFLLHGPRPTDNLQFTTVPKALARLQKVLLPVELEALREKVKAGVLPAQAVRTLYMQRGWI